jgi:hypothetical protein
MKHKRNRDIPDFSSKRAVSPKSPNPNPAPKAATPVPPNRQGKPQSTSSKSGRRGT